MPQIQKTDAYWTWVRAEAARIGSDGCTGVSEWHQDCCLEHDLACEFGRDPFSAWQMSLAGSASPWLDASDMPRRTADRMFRSCNLDRSGNPLTDFRSLVRYLGVRLGAWIGIGRR